MESSAGQKDGLGAGNVGTEGTASRHCHVAQPCDAYSQVAQPCDAYSQLTFCKTMYQPAGNENFMKDDEKCSTCRGETMLTLEESRLGDTHDPIRDSIVSEIPCQVPILDKFASLGVSWPS